jgi:SAM-dependent MidA family methyltransferase
LTDSTSAGNPRLLERIRDEIRSGGPMSFARFMDLALHDPEHGYYARGPEVLGAEGDYFTASDIGSAFGRCLAVQLEEMDGILGRPAPFTVVEIGAGRGLLARKVLDAVASGGGALAGRLRYVLADTSPGMREEAARTVPEARVVVPGIPGERYAGCVVAVELFDALAVHRVRRRDGSLREIFVDLSASGELIERELDPLPQSADLAERYGAAAREGDEAELCPALYEQLDAIERSLDRGFVFIVDYGHTAAELYGPAHSRGTLLAYHRHRTNEDYLLRVGRQDLTAHVNLTALEDGARERGFTVLGRTTQDRFLIAHGILAPFDEPDADRWNDPERVRERLRILQLIHPAGMGRIFHVIVLVKGVEPRPMITGLVDPFAR